MTPQHPQTIRSRLPSEVFAQQFWVCMVADRYAIPDDEARQIGELNARRLYDFW